MTETLFNPQHLRTSFELSQFLEGQQERDAVLQKRYVPLSYHHSFFKENFSFFSYVFLTLSSYLLGAFCLEKMSKRAWVYSRHAYADLTVTKTEKIFQSHFLARSINSHQKQTEDFYLSSLFPVPQLPYPEPLCHPFPSHIRPFHEKGICRGMSFWFVYLYLKTKPYRNLAIEHIRNVGIQFEQGANRQSSLLQSMNCPPIYGLLGFEVEENAFNLTVENRSVLQIARAIHSLPCGVYTINTFDHQIAYIKESETMQFLFDPTIGTIHVETPELLEKSLLKQNFSCPLIVDRYSII